MTKIREQNLTATKWSSNGDALGTVDFTREGYPFGANVFSPAVQKDRLSKDTYKQLQDTLARGAALDPSLADEVAEAMKEWALEHGATHYTPHVPAADRPHGGEARLLLRARRTRAGRSPSSPARS